MINWEKEALRRQAGLAPKKDLNESVSRIRTLDVEAKLLQSFSMLLKDFKVIKEMMDRPIPDYRGVGPGPMKKLSDEKGEIDKDALYDVAMNKVKLIEDAIDDLFGKESKKDDDDEEDEEDEEDYDDDDYEY